MHSLLLAVVDAEDVSEAIDQVEIYFTPDIEDEYYTDWRSAEVGDFYDEVLDGATVGRLEDHMERIKNAQDTWQERGQDALYTIYNTCITHRNRALNEKSLLEDGVPSLLADKKLHALIAMHGKEFRNVHYDILSYDSHVYDINLRTNKVYDYYKKHPERMKDKWVVAVDLCN